LKHELYIDKECGFVYLISPEIVHQNWQKSESGEPLFPNNFSRDINSDYLSDQSQHLKIKMKTDANYVDLINKIMTYSKGVKREDIILHRLRRIKGQ
jgi:hypothetical protein